MLVANLTRRNFVRDSLADCYCGMEDAVEGEYVKFEDVMVASSNSAQQANTAITLAEQYCKSCLSQSAEERMTMFRFTMWLQEQQQ